MGSDAFDGRRWALSVCMIWRGMQVHRLDVNDVNDVMEEALQLGRWMLMAAHLPRHHHPLTLGTTIALS